MKLFNKIVFYTLSCTWGCIMTIIGAFIALGCLITGHKPQRFHHMIYFRFGNSWGGLEAGLFFFCDKYAGLHTKQHETGHGFQNAVLGPLFPFMVAIPSATRYWLREFRTKRNKIIFSAVLYVILIALSMIAFIIAAITKPWVYAISLFILLYATTIFCWLLFIEIPQYDKGYVDYDSIWFEGQATRLGEKYCPNEVDVK